MVDAEWGVEDAGKADYLGLNQLLLVTGIYFFLKIEGIYIL